MLNKLSIVSLLNAHGVKMTKRVNVPFPDDLDKWFETEAERMGIAKATSIKATLNAFRKETELKEK